MRVIYKTCPYYSCPTVASHVGRASVGTVFLCPPFFHAPNAPWWAWESYAHSTLIPNHFIRMDDTFEIRSCQS